jgi:NADPH:quinone reductase-like Zn-dependent oxidoreductase
VNGYHPILAYRRALNANGICVVAGGSLSQVLQAMLLGPVITKLTGEKIGFQGIATTPKEDLLTIRELLEAGKIVPVIDKSFPLSQTVQAMRYIVEEHARGKVIIRVESDQKSESS